MKKWLGMLGLALGLFTGGALVANAVNIPLLSGPACSEASQMLSCLNQLIVQVNSTISPAQMAPATAPRNVLDNGAMAVQQRGTGVRTCGTTTIPSSAYAADRWGCNVNVTSGAGRLQVITTTPPAGFASWMVFYKVSGALAQPQCVMQEISTYRSVQVAGQVVTLSFYAQALANMITDNGGVINAYIFTGTGTDEGLQSFTASPAITPAWTGITSSLTQAFTATATTTRFNGTFQLPATETELAVALCWTPPATSTNAGVTDGFRFGGVQLEVGNAPSSYEFRAPAAELVEAERYFIRYNEIDTAGAIQFGGGTALGTTTTCSIVIPFPVTMRVAPTYANALSATTFTVTSASQAATVLGTPFSATLGANGVNNASINFTTTGMTAKDGCEITSTAAGAGVLDFTSDF